MDRSAKGSLIVTNILDGFSLGNCRRFTEFAKLSTDQTFLLYGIFNVFAPCLGQIDLSPNIVIQCNGSDLYIVGQRQDIICSIPVPPGMDPDTIELGWDYEEEFISDDGRVTIIEIPDVEPNNSSFNFSNSFITTIIRFDPLHEDDEGSYTCYSIVNESEYSTSIQLQYFRSMYVRMYIHMYVYKS